MFNIQLSINDLDGSNGFVLERRPFNLQHIQQP